jgi:hypothetical protein
MPRQSTVICAVAAFATLFAACDRHGGASARSSDGRVSQLSCGGMTYRIEVAKVSSDITAACERVNSSVQAERSYRAATVRYTCRDEKDHVVQSLPVPNRLLDDYEKNCREFTAAREALDRGLKDPTQDHRSVHAAYQAEYARFVQRGNELAKAYGADLSDFNNRTRTDRAALNHLIKTVGGSIEITG